MYSSMYSMYPHNISSFYNPVSIVLMYFFFYKWNVVLSSIPSDYSSATPPSPLFPIFTWLMLAKNQSRTQVTGQHVAKNMWLVCVRKQHRRRVKLNTEEKAKVVTAVWGTPEFIQFLAALAIPPGWFEENDQFIIFFKIVLVQNT